MTITSKVIPMPPELQQAKLSKELKKCPCVNCICVPVCRHKKLTYLYIECSILHLYISTCICQLKIGESSAHWLLIEDALNPTAWHVNITNNNLQSLVFDRKLSPIPSHGEAPDDGA